MRISRAACAVLLSVSICGCASDSNRESVNTDPENTNRFKAENYLNVSLVTDTRTGVQYVYVNGMKGGGVTVLVDADGRPLLADGMEGGGDE